MSSSLLKEKFESFEAAPNCDNPPTVVDDGTDNEGASITLGKTIVFEAKQLNN